MAGAIAEATTTRPKARQVATVQYVRAASAVAIVLFHTGLHFGVRIHVGEARVAVFFIVSGIVLWLITMGRRTDPRLFLARRLARIVPLYWLVTLLVFAKEAAGLTTHAHATLPQLVQSLLFLPHRNAAGMLFPVLVPGWTLVYEMFFCLLMAGLLWVRPERRLIWITVILAALAGAGAVLMPADPIGFVYTNPIMLDFLSGVWLAQMWSRRRLNAAGAVVLLTVGVAVSVAIHATPDERRNEILAWMPSLFIVVGALGLERPDRPPIRWLKAMGDGAYSIYLWHIPAISLAAWCLARVGVSEPVILIPLVTLIATLVGMVLYRVLEKPMTDALFARIDTAWAARRTPASTALQERAGVGTSGSSGDSIPVPGTAYPIEHMPNSKYLVSIGK